MGVKSVEIVLLATGLAAIATVGAFPQGFNLEKSVQASTGGLPFLQFADGGIRVNFGGYHAEAGLGGLLGGSSTKGGLHASAGTPSGAHASAGLGGLLNGDGAVAGGGLHARAGLGNNGPQAGAGLAGLLNGGAQQGSAGSSSSSSSGANSDFIQSRVQLEKEAPKNVYVEKQSSSFQQPGLAGVLYAGASTGGGGTVYKTVEKVANPGQKVTVTQKKFIPDAPVVASTNIQGGLYAGANAGGDSQIIVEKDVYPARWHSRKYLRNHPARKNIIYRNFDAGAQQGASASAGLAGGISARTGIDAASEGKAAVDGNVAYDVNAQQGSSLFDDIFNVSVRTNSRSKVKKAEI